MPASRTPSVRLGAGARPLGVLHVPPMLLLLLITLCASTGADDSPESVLHIAPSSQTGLLSDVGPLHPHAYRPNEFWANSIVYEGLVTTDGDKVGVGLLNLASRALAHCRQR